MALILKVSHPLLIRLRMQASINGYPVCPVLHARKLLSSNLEPLLISSKSLCIHLNSISGLSSIFWIKWHRQERRLLKAKNARLKMVASLGVKLWHLISHSFITSRTEIVPHVRCGDNLEQKFSAPPGEEILFRYLDPREYKKVFSKLSRSFHKIFQKFSKYF